MRSDDRLKRQDGARKKVWYDEKNHIFANFPRCDCTGTCRRIAGCCWNDGEDCGYGTERKQ
ncbi:hypothetical protein K170097C1_10680 [Hungatella effluvii]